MFRTSVNGTWGEPLTNTANINQVDTIEYTRVINENMINYKKEDISFVAFLYKDKPLYEVMQANEVHMIK